MNEQWVTIDELDQLNTDHLTSMVQVVFENNEQVVGILSGVHHELLLDEETGENNGASITELDIIVQKQRLTFVVVEEDTVRLLKNDRWA